MTRDEKDREFDIRTNLMNGYREILDVILLPENQNKRWIIEAARLRVKTLWAKHRPRRTEDEHD